MRILTRITDRRVSEKIVAGINCQAASNDTSSSHSPLSLLLVRQLNTSDTRH